MPRLASALPLLFATLAACADEAPVNPGVCTIEFTDESMRLARLDIDLLLVFSTSPSMADEQDVLPQELAGIGRSYDDEGAYPGVVHIGVVSADLGVPGVEGCTDTGDGARLRPIAGGARYLAREVLDDGTTERSHAALEELLPTLLPAPTGCPTQQPLEAARRVLAGEVADNAGFLREGSRLVVAFVTDQDDGSLAPDGSPADVAGLAAPFRGRHPESVIGAAYVRPAPRLDGFLDALSSNLRGSFDDLDAIVTPIIPIGGYGPVCLPESADLELDQPGLQVDCAIEQRFDDGPWSAVPACERAGEARPCWSIAPEPFLCLDPDGPSIVVERPHAPSPPGVLYTRAHCQRRCELTASPAARR